MLYQSHINIDNEEECYDDDVPELIEDSSSDEDENNNNNNDECNSDIEKEYEDIYLDVTHLRERCYACKIKFDSPLENKNNNNTYRKKKDTIEYLKKQKEILKKKLWNVYRI